MYSYSVDIDTWYLCIIEIGRDAYAGGQEGQLPPLPSSVGRGQEGQEFTFVLHSFHLSYLVKGHFPAL